MFLGTNSLKFKFVKIFYFQMVISGANEKIPRDNCGIQNLADDKFCVCLI